MGRIGRVGNVSKTATKIQTTFLSDPAFVVLGAMPRITERVETARRIVYLPTREQATPHTSPWCPRNAMICSKWSAVPVVGRWQMVVKIR